MVSEWISGPHPVIEHVTDILDRSVIDGKGIEKEPMPEGLEQKDGALKHWVIPNQIEIIPQAIPIERRRVDKNPGPQEQNQ